MKIQKNSVLTVVDNSGIKSIKCVGVLSISVLNPFQAVVGSIQSLRFKSNFSQGFKKGQLVKVLVVRFAQRFARASGLVLGSDSWGVVVLNASLRPAGSKIKGFVFKDLRRTGFLRLASLAKGII